MKKSNGLALAICLLFATDCMALTENEKLWLGVNLQQVHGQDNQWLSFLFAQIRLINESHPLQTGLVEGAIGYRMFKQGSIWLGYRWSGHDPSNGFSQENRLFQQVTLEARLEEDHRIISRLRLEEIERSTSNQIALKLRERLALEIGNKILGSTKPYFYDEIFLQLNHTNFTSNKLITENRLFLGFNIYTPKKSWWEVGYINQYQMRTPFNTANSMSHVASITYNLI